jgi:hypothetical protein
MLHIFYNCLADLRKITVRFPVVLLYEDLIPGFTCSEKYKILIPKRIIQV